MKLRTLATLLALTLSFSVHHGSLRLATPLAAADDGDGGGGDGGDDGNDGNDGDNGNDNGDDDDASEDECATAIDVGYSGFAALDPATLDALMDQSAAQGYGNIGQQAGAIGAATAAAAMDVGIDPLGASNMGIAAAVAAQAAIDANQGNHGIATNAAQAVGLSAITQAYDLSQDQVEGIAAGISNEVESWGNA